MWAWLAVASAHLGLPWEGHVKYTRVRGAACSLEQSMAVGFSESTYTEDLSGLPTQVPVRVHQCFTKCQQCSGDSALVDGYKVPCFCDGLCTGPSEFCEAADDISSTAVCGDEHLCKELCDAEPGCYGVQVATSENGAINRCFLQFRPCQELLLQGLLPASATFDYLARVDTEEMGYQGVGTALCPLGLVVEADALHHHAKANDDYAMVGSYADGKFQVAGAGEQPRVRWDASGCGWVVEAPFAVAEAAVGADVPETCACHDSTMELSWLFGTHPRADFLAGEEGSMTCADAEPWLQHSYCGNPIFAAVCPRTCVLAGDLANCAACDAMMGTDHAEAAQLLGDMLGIATTCDALSEFCTDPVIAVVCAAACAARDVDNDRRLEAEVRTPLVAMPLGRPRKAARRLAEVQYEAIYTTWDVVHRPAMCANDNYDAAKGAPADPTLLSNVNLYDMVEYQKPAPDTELDAACPEQKAYVTTPKSECAEGYHYFPRAGAADEAEQKAFAEQCFNKCLDDGTTAAYNTVGGPAHCEGADPTHDQESGVLCMVREDCEALCDALGDKCQGFEMHRSRPRCYLMTGGDQCTPGRQVPSQQYDLVLKADRRVKYVTESYNACSGSATLAVTKAAGAQTEPSEDLPAAFQHSCKVKCDPNVRGSQIVNGGDPTLPECDGWEEADAQALCLERDQCEAICTAHQNCAGFKMLNGKSQCILTEDKPNQLCFQECGRGISSPCLAGYDFGSIPRGEGAAPTAVYHPGVYHYVLKVRFEVYDGALGRYVPPCIATIHAGLGADAQFRGEYTLHSKTAAVCQDQGTVEKPVDNDCYAKSDHERLVWAYSSLFDSPLTGEEKSCSGWVVQRWDAFDENARERWGEARNDRRLSEGDATPAPATGKWTSYFTTCASHEYTPYARAGDSDIKLAKAPLYYYAPNRKKARLDFQCKKYPRCPLLGTCALAQGRFHQELALLRDQVPEDNLLTKEPAMRRKFGASFTPKAIVSVERADAFIYREKLEHTKALFRNTPGHFRLEVESVGAALTAVSLTRAADEHVPFGAKYAVPDGHEPWYSDIVRVETANPDGSAGTGTTVLFYAPGVEQLKVFAFDPVATGPAGLDESGRLYIVPVRAHTGQLAATHVKDGYWRVVLPAGIGDYAATIETPCPSELPIVDYSLNGGTAACGTAAGTVCKLQCEPGYKVKQDFVCGMGAWGDARLGIPIAECVATPYIAEDSLYMLTHRSRLDYGWRIREILAYSNAECAGNPVTVRVDSTTGDYNAFGKDGLVDEGSLNMVSETMCNGMVDDKDRREICKDWWSADLNANPYSVDETHETVQVRFSVSASINVQCIQVISRSLHSALNSGPFVKRQYYPSEAALYRGYKRRAGGGEGAPPSAKDALAALDGWTQVWTAKADAAKHADLGATHEFHTVCGKRGYALGELVRYEQTVPTSCHCQQACVETEGCATWRFKTDTTECWLMGELLEVDHASCEGDNFLWGEPGVRLEGASLEDGVLTVFGKGLPTATSLDARNHERQRVKVVTKGESCAGAMPPAEVEGLGCVAPNICTVKPSTTSSTAASFRGLKLAAGTALKQYTVCYYTGTPLDRYAWHAVPGALDRDGDDYSWTVEFEDATSEDETLDGSAQERGFALTVTGPAFVWDADNWQVKFVRKTTLPGYDCTVAADAAFTVDAGRVGETNQVSFNVTVASSAAAADYSVCFAVNATEAADFRPIPAASGALALTVKSAGVSREVYGGQQLSLSTLCDQKLVLAGRNLPKPSFGAVAIAKDCAKLNLTDADSFVWKGFATADSTADGLSFDADASVAGTYSLCYCDASADTSLTPSADTYYSLEESTQCNAAMAPTGDNADDLCSTKCARGCTGSNCHCDGWNAAQGGALDLDNALCLPPAECKAACDAEAGCEGFTLSTDFAGVCWLDAGCPAPETQDGVQHWKLEAGAACGEEADFGLDVGTVTVSERAGCGTWVLDPTDGAEQSLEVAGAGLDWVRDRVMLVAKDGVCGVSDPVGQDALWYARNAAVPSTLDPPLNDMEGPYEAPVANKATYQKTTGAYCAGDNVPKAQLPPTCYDECHADASGPNCTGFFYGTDTADSSAVCRTAAQCVDACTELDGCVGVSMHKTLPRCFLRTSCTLRTHDGYDVYVKGQDRRLTSKWGPPAEAADKGFSWAELLRFPSLSVPAGTYKACFCDSALTTAQPGVCLANKADFKVELGSVHVSGVECLLRDAKHQRSKCYAQGYGGLRCHDAEAPPAAPAEGLPPVSEIEADPADEEVAASVSAWCLYGPEEETDHHPVCEFVRRL